MAAKKNGTNNVKSSTAISGAVSGAIAGATNKPKDNFTVTPLKDNSQFKPAQKPKKVNTVKATGTFEPADKPKQIAQPVKQPAQLPQITPLAKEALRNRKQLQTFDPVKDATEVLRKGVQVKVTTLTVQDYTTLKDKLDNGGAEMWYIDDGEAVRDTKYGAATVGRSKLSGITDDDKIVIYDSETGKVFRYGHEDTEYKNAVQRTEVYSGIMQLTSEKFNLEVAPDLEEIKRLEDEIKPYITRMETEPLNAEEYAEVQELFNTYTALNDKVSTAYKQYEEKYTGYLDNYTENKARMEAVGMSAYEYEEYLSLKQKQQEYEANLGTPEQLLYDQYQPLNKGEKLLLEEFEARVTNGGTVLFMNKEFEQQINSYADTVQKAVSEQKESTKYFSNMLDAEQINSLSDVIRRAVFRECFSGEKVKKTNLLNVDPTSVTLEEAQDYLKNNTLSDVVTAIYQVIGKPVEVLSNELRTTFALKDRVEEAKHDIKAKYVSGEITKQDLQEAMINLDVAEHVKVVNSFSHAGLAFLNNFIVFAGETSDMPNNLLKPALEAGNYYDAIRNSILSGSPLPEDMAANPQLVEFYEQSQHFQNEKAAFAAYMWKDFWGVNGRTPSYDWDAVIAEDERTLGNMLVCGVMDVLFDPTSFVGFFTKAQIPDSVVNDVAAAMRRDYAKAGIVIEDTYTDKLNGKIYKYARKAVASALNDGADLSNAYVKNILKGLNNWDMVENKPIFGVSSFIKKHNYADYAAEYAKRISDLTENAVITSSHLPVSMSDSYRMINSLSTRKEMVDALDELIGKASLSPITLPIGVFRKVSEFAHDVTHVSDDAAKAMCTFAERFNQQVAAIKKDSAPMLPYIREVVHEFDKEYGTAAGYIDDLPRAAHFKPEIFREIIGEIQVKELDEYIKALKTGGTSALDDIIYEHTKHTSMRSETFAEYVDKLVPKLGSYGDYFTADATRGLYRVKEMYELARRSETIGKVEGYLDNLMVIRTKLDKVFEAFEKDINQYFDWEGGIISNMPDEIFYGMFDNINALRNSIIPEYLPEKLSTIGDLNGLALSNTVWLRENNGAKFFEILDRLSDDFDEYSAMRGLFGGKSARARANELEGNIEEYIGFIAKNVLIEYRDNLRAVYADANFKLYVPEHLTDYEVPDVANLRRTTVADIAKAISDQLMVDTGYSFDPVKIQNEVLSKKTIDILTQDGTVKLENIDRLYSINISKASVMKHTVDDHILQEYVDTVLDRNSPVRVYLQRVLDKKDKNTELNTDIRTLLEQCATHDVNREFVEVINNIDDSVLPQDQKLAILDAIAGGGTAINKMYKATNWKNNNSIGRTSDKITSYIVDRAATFYTRNGDLRDAKCFEYGCNTLDTSANLEAMFRALNKIETADGRLMKDVLAEDSEEFVNVYYSASANMKNADPFMMSFKVWNSDTVTFINKDNPYRATNYGQHYTMDGTAEELMEQYQRALSTHDAVPAQEYYNGIEDYITLISAQAATHGKKIRFVGFNNSAMGSGQDKYLRKLAVEHMMDIQTSTTIDLGNVVRGAKGIPCMTDTTVDTVKNAVKYILTYATGKQLSYGTANALVYDFDVPLAVYAKAVVPKLPRTLDNFEVPVSTITRLADFSDYRTLEKNAAIKGIDDILLNEHALKELIARETNGTITPTNLNCMRLIKRAGSTTGYDLNLVTEINAMHTADWFDLKALNTFLALNEDANNNVYKLWQEVRKLDEVYDAIKVPETLNAVGADLLKDMIKIHLNNVPFEEVTTDPLLYALTGTALKTDDPVRLYSVLYLLNREYPNAARIKVSKLEAYNMLNLLLDEDVANAVIFNIDGIDVFDRDVQLVTSKYASAVSEVNLKASNEAAFEDAIQYAQSFDLYLSGKDTIMELNGIYSGVERIQYEIFEQMYAPYRKLTTDLQAYLHYYDNFIDTTKDLTKKHVAIANRNLRVKMAKRSISRMSNLHTQASVRMLLSMSEKDFVAHVVRDCKNIKVIDPNATVFKENTSLLQTLVRRLDSFNLEGSLKVEMNKDGLYIIYKDLSGYSVDDLRELLKQYNDYDIKGLGNYYANWVQNRKRELQQALQMCVSNDSGKVTRNSIKRKFKKINPNFKEDLYAEFGITEQTLLDYLDTANGLVPDFSDNLAAYARAMQVDMPSNYYLSNLEACTQEYMQNLQQLVPQESRLDLNLINRGYDWFDNSFSCNVIGDIDVQKQFNPYFTSNILNSMAAGLHHARTSCEAMSNYFRLYYNPTQTLGYMLEHSGAPKDVALLRKAIEQNGYVLHRLVERTDGKFEVKKITLKTDADLARNLDCVCTTNEEYLTLFAYAKGKNKKISEAEMTNLQKNLLAGFSYWRNNIRSARITAWLGANFLGSSTRNWAQALQNAYQQVPSPTLLTQYIAKAPELNQRYSEAFADITRAMRTVNPSTVDHYIREGGDLHGLSVDEFHTLYSLKATAIAGFADGMHLMKDNQASKMLGMVPETSSLHRFDIIEDGASTGNTAINGAQKVYQKIQAKHWNEASPDPLIMQAEVRKAFEDMNKYSDSELDELSSLYHTYLASPNTFMERIQETPIIGKYIEYNLNNFSSPEEVVRTGLALYYMEEYGYTANRAGIEVAKAEFDYSSRPKFLEAMETVFPFATFKLYNAKYWFTEAPKHRGIIRANLRLLKYMGHDMSEEDIIDTARNDAYRRKLASGEIGITDTGTVNQEDVMGIPGLAGVFSGSIVDTLENYKGIPDMFANEYLRISDHHVLKIGSTFLEALNLFSSALFAIPQLLNGELPDIIADNVYSPLLDLGNIIGVVLKDGLVSKRVTDEDGRVRYTGLAGYVDENWRNVIELLPFWGTLTNTVISHIKNGSVAIPDLIAISLDPALQAEYVHSMYVASLDVLSVIIPSLISFTYETDEYLDRPIGRDWYGQSEQYQATHRYITGISYLPSFIAKDPSTYINYRGMYKKMGYTDAEVNEILTFLFDKDGDGNYTYDRPGVYQYSTDRINDTLENLVTRGYSAEEAIKLITGGVQWVDVNGEVRSDAHIMSDLLNSAFLMRYDGLPDYIKYDKGLYADLKAYYKGQGYNPEQVWMMMQSRNGYITEHGAYTELTEQQRILYENNMNTEFLEFLNGLPDWFKYEQGAAMRTVTYVCNHYGMDVDEARDYIKQNNLYVDEDGKVHSYTEAESKEKTAQTSKEFTEFYDKLPDYMKYEKGAYGRTLAYLKSLGLTTEAAKAAMLNGAYYTPDGRLIDCRQLQHASKKKTYERMPRARRSGYYSNKFYNAYRKFYPKQSYYVRGVARGRRLKKPYVTKRSYSSTYSLVNKIKGWKFGTQYAFRVKLGFSAVRSSLSTKSTYPAAYRNIVYGHRRNLYKENYARYGTSRILMRANAIGYSNASITKYRRNEIYNRMKYAGRRSRF